MDDELEVLSQSFSKRHNYVPCNVEIQVREDAPPSFRYWLPRLAMRHGMSPDAVRSVVCDALRTPPDRNIWSNETILKEIEALLRRCDWYRVYDVAEELAGWIAEHDEGNAIPFVDALNEFFQEEGIGWEFDKSNGTIASRGDAEFQMQTKTASETLNESGYRTAKHELEQALADLSRRPQADLTGAIQHAMAAMECVAREFCGEPQPTFGKLVERHPDMLPRPLGQGVEKAWGYASEMGRHVREGRVLEREEAELIVGIAASVSTYLTRKKAREG
jgi:hypothetical protein